MRHLLYLFALPLLLPAMRAQAVRHTDSIAADTGSRANKKREKKLLINGYVKDMQILSFSKDFGTLSATNLIHNRINVKWMPVRNLTLATELRNRLIWGDDVRQLPDYTKLLRNANERIDLSKTWWSNNSLVLHTNTDRLYADYRFRHFGVRLGRQRINWGMATTWNPNDLFNTYNFLDFDYEERPGSDAVRLNAEFGRFSGIELAYSPGNRTTRKVLAGKYTFNTRGYDIQVVSGIFGRRFTAGAGWAGSIGDAGFKGESQYFTKTATEPVQINLAAEIDYVFSGGWYLNAGFLFNNNGTDTRLATPTQVNFVFDPAHLMPTRWNIMAGTGKQFQHLFSANFSVLYAPGTHLLLLLPGLRYSLTQNIDADLTWQSFFARSVRFEALNHRGFLRLKYAF